MFMISLLAILFFGFTATANAGDFRDLNFGQAPTKDMVKIKSGIIQRHTGTDDYTCPSDNLQFGSGKAFTIRYSFWRDKLFIVSIHFQGNSNYRGILEAATAKFGQPHKVKTWDYEWRNLEKYDLKIYYAGSSKTKQGSLSLRSKDIVEQIRASKGTEGK